jgi:hypothetical protein
MTFKRDFITSIFNAFIANPKPFTIIGKGGKLIAVERSHEDQHRYQMVIVLTDLSPAPMSPQYVYGENDRERFIRWVNRNTYMKEVQQCADDLCPEPCNPKNP